VAKVKVINNNLDSNLNGTNFNNIPSETIFSFGRFAVTSNFDGRTPIDYTNQLSSFVRPVTLETMGVSDTQSEILHNYATNAVLNLDKSDLNTFVRFGSAYEFLRTSIENIITNYPGSIFMNSQIFVGGNTTFTNFSYDNITDTSTFQIPINSIVNKFGLAYNFGNVSVPDGVLLKNLNLSFEKYVVWSASNSTGNSYSVIGFTGYTGTSLYLKVSGNPFPTVTGTSANLDFHIKPNNAVFEEFRALLTDYQKYIVAQRDGTNGFKFVLKDPTLLEDGTIVYNDALMSWSTGDKYNIDIDTPNYRKFLEIVLTIGTKFDAIKTDLIARFLTPASLKTYDLTEEGKMTKLLRIYGEEFDQLRQFIDSLVNINRITYDKINNIPDQLIKNLSRTFGWNYFSLVNENELVESFLTIDDAERNLNTDLLPAEIDIELWRRILLNTNYFWKSKGTRDSIKSMFLLIGIPEPFINITEYVYTVEGKINPNSVTLSQADFPSNSLPYDNSGYPVAPLEIPEFYFQVSGDTDSGQAYMNVFRKAGFRLTQTVDNKKSWIEAGAATRVDNTTPQYYQADSKLILNTKEVDVALDTARGIEFDVYDYIKNVDFPANSSGFTLPFSYVNISLGVSASQVTFPMPAKTQGDFEVRFNGILLNAPKTGDTSGTTTGVTYQADYSINYSANTFTLLTASAHSNSYHRDVIQATYIYSGNTHPVSGITVEYIVARVNAKLNGTVIPLPSYPRGDVQVTINGIALTKGTPQFTADYILDPANTTGSSQIIIQNSDVIAYLAVNPTIQVAYVEVDGSNDVNARSEVVRIDSFNTGKIYFNNSANKYVFKLNYKANTASDLKILVDGIALEPYTDYSINTQNQYEVFLPKGLHYGSVISVYYLVALSSFFNPIIGNSFGVGDITNLSFLEFIDLIQRKLINARNRKTITDFKGGWYPSLLNVYIQYLKRAELASDDPLLSNGYTFENLYSFLSKYNAFFQRFVDQLLSATIILKRSGLLIRNTIFTKQKYTYKRGVNFDFAVNYFGDDGSTFLVKQDLNPPPPPPPTLFVETIVGTFGSLITGGMNIQGNTLLTEYGIEFKNLEYYGDINAVPIGLENIMDDTFEVEENGGWTRVSIMGSLPTDTFTMRLTGLTENTAYQYRAFIKSGVYGYTGNTLSITTPAPPVVPSIQTKLGTAAINSISTGGININVFADVQYYAMQYRVPFGAWILSPAVPLSGPLGVDNFTRTISGLNPSTVYEYRAYMVVSGTPYYGNIISTATLPLPLVAPTVVTGLAYSASTTGIKISGNTVTNHGNVPPLNEYGVLYTQNGTYGTAACLRYNNLPTNVKKASTLANIATGVTYAKTIGSLSPNTTTYYRAFAKNASNCCGYGTVKTIQTLAIPESICISSIPIGINYSSGFVVLNPVLTSGQYVTVDFFTYHRVYTVGVSETSIYCKPNGGGSFVLVCSDQTTAAEFCRTCSMPGIQINYGDCVCFQNCSTGNSGSCSTVCLQGISGSSPDLSTSLVGNTISTVSVP